MAEIDMYVHVSYIIQRKEFFIPKYLKRKFYNFYAI